jgi:hypothetical protein
MMETCADAKRIGGRVQRVVLQTVRMGVIDAAWPVLEFLNLAGELIEIGGAIGDTRKLDRLVLHARKQNGDARGPADGPLPEDTGLLWLPILDGIEDCVKSALRFQMLIEQAL